MKSFLEYLKEETDTKTGNYVSLSVSDMPSVDIGLETGKISKSFHVTLMYSKESKRNPNTIKKNIEKQFPTEVIAKVLHASGFDSEEDGTTAIVLELDAPILNKMHSYLKMEGLKHSYDDFKPHLTLAYDVKSSEAKKMIEGLNKSEWIGKEIKLSGFDSTTIKEDWNKE